MSSATTSTTPTQIATPLIMKMTVFLSLVDELELARLLADEASAVDGAAAAGGLNVWISVGGGAAVVGATVGGVVVGLAVVLDTAATVETGLVVLGLSVGADAAGTVGWGDTVVDSGAAAVGPGATVDGSAGGCGAVAVVRDSVDELGSTGGDAVVGSGVVVDGTGVVDVGS
jgi:hypothetical protein